MARINVEDCWWTDPRRSRLAKLVGDEDKADGMAVRMWRLAQQFWGRGRKRVPLEVFETLEANAKLVEAKLAKVEGDEVYICGSSQYLDWIHDKREAAATGGRASAQRPRDEMGRLLPKSTQAASKQSPSERQAKPKQVQASGSISGSISGSNSNSGERESFRKASALPPLAEIWNSWCGDLAKVRGTNASRNRKAQQRFAEAPEAEWVECVKRIASSDFCRGQSERGWKATFDWLLQPETRLKVLEGKYDGSSGKSARSSAADAYISKLLAEGGESNASGVAS